MNNSIIEGAEIWVPVVGYDYDYTVSNHGRICGTRGVMKPYDNGYGYLVVEFQKNGKKKHLRVHRLVAEAFVPNPDDLPEVNHRDENKHNNHAANLEWCTSSYNKKYGSGIKSRSESMKRVWSQRRADNAVD